MKPAASSHVEKEPASSVGSPRAAKAESLKLSRPSLKESEISLQTVKPGPGPTSMSLPGASKAPLSSGSDTLQSPALTSMPSALVVPPKDSSAATISGEGSRHEIVDVPDFALSGQKKLGTNADPLDQVMFACSPCGLWS